MFDRTMGVEQMSKLIEIADAANPSAGIAKGVQGVAGYIGGDAAHVWTTAEWGRFNGLKKLPIFVRSSMVGHSAFDDAFTALHALFDLKVPHGTALALDLETAVDSAYVNQFGDIIQWAGYHVWPYGSTSTLFKNPPRDGYWVAFPDGKPVEFSHKNVRMTQFAFQGSRDVSVVTELAWIRRLKAW
jgi:hypothetical protein